MNDGRGRTRARELCVPSKHQVPADRVCEHPDESLPKKLSDPLARAALLAWALEGLRAYQRGGLRTCSAVDRASGDYWRDMNPISGWIEDCCEIGPGSGGMVEVKASFEEWLGGNITDTPTLAA